MLEVGSVVVMSYLCLVFCFCLSMLGIGSYCCV